MSLARLVAVPWIVIEVLTEEVATVPPWGRGPGLWLAALLAAGGAVLHHGTRSARTLRGAHTVAFGGILLDSTIVFGFVWLYASQPLAGMWAALYVLPLEGAAFFALTGALGTWALASVGYAVIQIAATDRFAMPLSWNSVGFTLGVGFIIALIAGSLARSLNREREALEHELEERLRAEEELEERHRQLNEAREIARLGAWEWDLATDSVTWSEGVYEIHGLDPDTDPEPERFLHLQHPADRDRVRLVLERALQECGSFSVDYRIIRPDGEERFLRGKGETVVGEDGAATGLFGTIQDITAQRSIEDALQHANAELQRSVTELEERNHQATLTASMGEMLLSCVSRDEASAVVRDFGQRMFPGSCGELAVVEGASLSSVTWWPGERADADASEVDACWALRRRQPHVVAAGPSVQRCAHLTGDEIASICVPLIAQGDILGVLTIGQPSGVWMLGTPGSSSRRLAQTMAEYVGLALANLNLRDELREQSLRDPLTGLSNRRHLRETLDRELQRAERAGTPLALLAIDIDHFKEVNDTAGHAAGDATLRDLGAYLLSEIRGSDTACRSGGDEFTVVLVGATVDEAASRAEQLRRGCAAALRSREGAREISLSIGVAGYPTHGTDAETLQHMADTALYKAKRAGRDRVAICASTVKPVTSLHIATG